MSGLATDDADDEWKCGCGNDHAGGVNTHAADPFFQIVSFGSENKPLISEERECDAEKISQEASENVPVSEDGI